EEGRKGGGERDLLEALQAYCCADQLLFGDVPLEEPVRIGFFEPIGEGGVADLTIERDHVGFGRSECLESIAIGLAGGDLCTAIVGGRLEFARFAQDGGSACARRLGLDADVAFRVAQFGQCLLCIGGGEGFAMPAFVVGQEG